MMTLPPRINGLIDGNPAPRRAESEDHIVFEDDLRTQPVPPEACVEFCEEALEYDAILTAELRLVRVWGDYSTFIRGLSFKQPPHLGNSLKGGR